MKFYDILKHFITTIAFIFASAFWGIASLPSLIIFSKWMSISSNFSYWPNIILTAILLGACLTLWLLSVMILTGILGFACRPRNRNGSSYPLYSLTTVKWAILSVIQRLASPFGSLFSATWVITIYYKLLGTRIGKNAIVNTHKIWDAYLINIDDVTELVSAQKNAAWSNVARYMAHEIKNPLTPIKLSAQRLENFLTSKNNVNKETFFNCTNTIVRQVNNIESLVTEFSNFARMPSGNFQDSRLDNIIKTQINSQKLVYKNAQFDYKISKKNLVINCDYNQLSRVFLNLFKNSLESINSKKKIVTINVLDDKKFIFVEISDNGTGFPKDSDNLFEPYVTNKINGTGLGLSICKKIIEDHGGEISLHNNAKFKGALVKIKLLRKRK